MEQNYDLRTLRLKRGMGLEDIANSIRRLSLSRLCKFEDNCRSTTVYVHEVFQIMDLLNLNEEESRGFINWVSTHYVDK